MTVAAARRRADRHEHGIGLPHRAGQAELEGEQSLTDVPRNQLSKTRLVDRHPAAFEGRDLGLVGVHAGNVMAEIGEAGPRFETDAAGTDHRDPAFRFRFPRSLRFCRFAAQMETASGSAEEPRDAAPY
jgi:hypothetical protein